MSNEEIITSHHVGNNPMNLTVTAVPVTRYGMPTFNYQITKHHDGKDGYQFIKDFSFQIGNPARFGVNGVTNEVLLAIIKHRLEGFQENPNAACVENQLALDHVNQALMSMHNRTNRIQNQQ